MIERIADCFFFLYLIIIYATLLFQVKSAFRRFNYFAPRLGIFIFIPGISAELYNRLSLVPSKTGRETDKQPLRYAPRVKSSLCLINANLELIINRPYGALKTRMKKSWSVRARARGISYARLLMPRPAARFSLRPD